MFIAGKILAAVVFPPGLFVVLGAIALVLAALKRRKAAAGVALGSLILLYAMSTTAFASLAIAPLENAYPVFPGDARDAAAIVVLGGGYDDNSPEYAGTPPDRILLESASVDTRTNALGTASRFRGRPVILVTSASHMPRSMLSFRKAGMLPVPAPTDYRAKRTPLTWPDFLPSTGALETSTLAIHEAVGFLWYLARP